MGEGLSKDYLRGDSAFDDAAVHPVGFYEEHAIELRTGTAVVAVDPGASEVETAGGERIGFDRLLLATGSEPRRLSTPGADLAGVLYLRTLADADALRAAIPSAGPLVVVGAGWIGCEVAASARQLGADVAIVEPARLPLEAIIRSGRPIDTVRLVDPGTDLAALVGSPGGPAG